MRSQSKPLSENRLYQRIIASGRPVSHQYLAQRIERKTNTHYKREIQRVTIACVMLCVTLLAANVTFALLNYIYPT